MANMVLPLKYAEALYKAALESNTLAAVTEELKSIQSIITATPKLKSILMHPGINKAEKKEMVKQLFGERVTKLSLRLIMLLIEKKREAIFDDICRVFIERMEEQGGLKKITIETAFPLEQLEKEGLISRLEKAMNKKLVVETKVNPSMLGGIIIKERMRQMDASIFQFLKSMRADLDAVKITSKKSAGKPKATKAKKVIKKKAVKKTVKKSVKKRKK